MVSGKLPLGKFPPIKSPQENSLPENSHPENSHLEYSHSCFQILPPTFVIFLFFYYCQRYHWYYLKDCFVILFLKWWSQTCCNVFKNFVACRPFIYLKKWKQLLRVGLLYNTKVIEDTVKHNEKFSNFFSSNVLYLEYWCRVNSPQWTAPSKRVDI